MVNSRKEKPELKKIVPDFFLLIQFVGNCTLFTLFICHHGSTTTTTTTEKGTHRSNWNIWTK